MTGFTNHQLSNELDGLRAIYSKYIKEQKNRSFNDGFECGVIIGSSIVIILIIIIFRVVPK